MKKIIKWVEDLNCFFNNHNYDFPTINLKFGSSDITTEDHEVKYVFCKNCNHRIENPFRVIDISELIKDISPASTPFFDFLVKDRVGEHKDVRWS